jgi:hypothetical protein
MKIGCGRLFEWSSGYADTAGDSCLNWRGKFAPLTGVKGPCVVGDLIELSITILLYSSSRA